MQIPYEMVSDVHNYAQAYNVPLRPSSTTTSLMTLSTKATFFVPMDSPYFHSYFNLYATAISP